MAQALSRRPLTLENRLQSHTTSCGAYGDKRPLQQVLLQVHQFSRASMIPTMNHIPSPITHTTAQTLFSPSFLCVCVCVREGERDRDRERISLLGTVRQRQCGTNISSLKINRLLTSRYKTLHLLFMYLCDHSIFLYVRIYYAIQSALFPSAKTEPSKGCQRSLTLVMYSPYQRTHCRVPLASQQVYIPFACSFVSKKLYLQKQYSISTEHSPSADGDSCSTSSETP